MNVVLTNRQRTKKINLRLLKQIAWASLADLLTESAELGIHLVGAREMTRLNGKFLRHQGPTDVITFDYSDRGRAGCPQPAARPGAMRTSRPTLHGDIFICVDEAVRAGRRFRTAWQ